MSLPGRAGDELHDLIVRSMALGGRLLSVLTRHALERLLRRTGGELGVIQATTLFDPTETQQLADSLAAAIGTAQLLGRAQIRLRREQALRRQGIDPAKAGAVVESVLAVPERRQETPYSCGAAALQSVLAFFGQNIPENILRDELGTDPEQGTPPDAILRVARAHGLDADGRDGLTVFDLAKALDAGCPVLCPIQAYGTDAEAKRLQTGHWVVVIGYDDKGLWLQDPVAGQVSLGVKDFDRAWYDQDADGQVCDHYGIVLGPPAMTEGRRPLQEVAPLPPERAVQYFTGLVPTLGTDVQRFGDDLRRHAFTVAAATDRELLDSVQNLVRQRLQTGQGFGSAPREIDAMLDAAGVSPANPQYAEAVFRTNTHDAYHQAATEALQDPDTIDTFPVWQYSNPHDSRSRPSHAARDGNYYPSSVPFTQVRGTDAGDVINCRCDFLPIDKWEWTRRRGSGARIADGYPDVPGIPPQPAAPAALPAPVPAPAPATAATLAPTLAAAGAVVPPARRSIVDVVAGKVASRFATMQDRYGRNGALAVMGAMVALAPVPLPGVSLVPIGLAEAWLKLSKLLSEATEPAPPAVTPELVRAVRELLAEVYAAGGEPLPEWTDAAIAAALAAEINLEKISAPRPG